MFHRGYCQDLLRQDALIGRNTINTLPVETLNAYRNHGEPADRIEQETTRAHWMLEQLPELGICLDDVTQQLENEGVSKFNQSFDQLMGSMRQAVYK